MEIPTGNSPEDVAARRKIIANFYREWKIANPSLKRYNLSLKEDINIRHVSITETCTHASRTYLSTLSVLQLDAILTYAKKVGTAPVKDNGNHEKVQYCITAIKG
ncbi:MAG: hypothetical protein SPK80_01450 [Bacteroidales bacterium]|nr:hypothetical protein [Bacteroidales bacterium]